MGGALTDAAKSTQAERFFSGFSDELQSQNGWSRRWLLACQSNESFTAICER